MILLVRFGIVSIEKMRTFRRFFIVIAFVIAAIVTPPDVAAGTGHSMCLLYEASLLAAAKWFVNDAHARPEAAIHQTLSP